MVLLNSKELTNSIKKATPTRSRPELLILFYYIDLLVQTKQRKISFQSRNSDMTHEYLMIALITYPRN